MLRLVNINAGTTDALLQAAQKTNSTGMLITFSIPLHTEAKDIGGYVKELISMAKKKLLCLLIELARKLNDYLNLIF